MMPPRPNSRPPQHCLRSGAHYLSAQRRHQQIQHPLTGQFHLLPAGIAAPMRISTAHSTHGCALKLLKPPLPSPLLQIQLQNKTH